MVRLPLFCPPKISQYLTELIRHLAGVSGYRVRRRQPTSERALYLPSQAGCCGFDPRRPLHCSSVKSQSLIADRVQTTTVPQNVPQGPLILARRSCQPPEMTLATDFKSASGVLTSCYCALPSRIYRRFSRQSKLRLAWYKHVSPSSSPHLEIRYAQTQGLSSPTQSAAQLHEIEILKSRILQTAME